MFDFCLHPHFYVFQLLFFIWFLFSSHFSGKYFQLVVYSERYKGSRVSKSLPIFEYFLLCSKPPGPREHIRTSKISCLLGNSSLTSLDSYSSTLSQGFLPLMIQSLCLGVNIFQLYPQLYMKQVNFKIQFLSAQQH